MVTDHPALAARGSIHGSAMESIRATRRIVERRGAQRSKNGVARWPPPGRLLEWEKGPRERGERRFPSSPNIIVTWVEEKVARKALAMFFALRDVQGWDEHRFRRWMQGITEDTTYRPKDYPPQGIQDLTATEAHLVINAAQRLIRRTAHAKGERVG